MYKYTLNSDANLAFYSLAASLAKLLATEQVRVSFNSQSNEMQSKYVACNNLQPTAWWELSLRQIWSCLNSHRASVPRSILNTSHGPEENYWIQSHACKLNSDRIQRNATFVFTNSHMWGCFDCPIKMLFHDICGGNMFVEWFQHMEEKKKQLATVSPKKIILLCHSENIVIANTLNSISVKV